VYEHRTGRVANCGRAKADKDRERERGVERESVERRGDERDKGDENRITCVERRKQNRTTSRIKEEGIACERER